MNCLKIMILTDGKMGDLMPCRGVAQALADVSNIDEKVIQPGTFHSLPLPYMPVQRSDQAGQAGSLFDSQVPDIVIAAGRRTIPYLRYFKNYPALGKKPFTVFLKDPRIHRRDIDFIWAPSHDQLTGKNVFSTDTSPHTMSQDRLNIASKTGEKRFQGLSRPLAGVILGGNSKTVSWDQSLADKFASQLAQLTKGQSVLVTSSRRTPNLLLNAVKNTLSGQACWIWDDQGNNPYSEILACSDRLVITGDSHNMVSEALAASKPVHVFRPNGLSKKLNAFLDRMEAIGALNDLSKNTNDLAVNAALDSTNTIAEEILKRYQTIQS